MSELAECQETQVARPLSELKPLILADLRAGDEAGLPHYTKAGEKLIEARAHKWKEAADFWEWAERSFDRSKSQLSRYMTLAKATNAGEFHRRRVNTLEEAVEAHTSAELRAKSWQAPVQEKLTAFDWTKYNQERAEKAKEQQLIDKLILEMLDIGYKVLAVKFHPDKQTGSAEAMQRLNAARKQAKERLS